MRQLFYVNAFVVYIINCHLWRSCERKNNFSTFVVESYEDIYFMSVDIYDYHWMQRKNLFGFMSWSHGDDRKFSWKIFLNAQSTWWHFELFYTLYTRESPEIADRNTAGGMWRLYLCAFIALYSFNSRN